MTPPSFPTEPSRAQLSDTGRGTVAAYQSALERLNALIQPAAAQRDGAPAAIRARAEMRLDRLRRFLDSLGNPHRLYPIVHVGGTSGKGSTATAIEAILRAGGHRVGLHTSPYLQVATEKIQIGGLLISGEAFANLVEEVMAAAAAWSTCQEARPVLTYGEIWFVLTALHFARERVDLAVIEVGAGGRFDLTNVVKPAVSVITSVGLDHVETLGATIPQIAWHKAGIIKRGAPAITAVTAPDALEPLIREARLVGTTLQPVALDDTFDLIDSGPDRARWRERGAQPGDPFITALPGRFQATNAALAVATVRALADLGFRVDERAIRTGLLDAKIPGRAETMPTRNGPQVILDGAHNPQKMAALSDDLPSILGDRSGRGAVVLLAALGGKDLAGMIAVLAPRASTIVATAVSVPGKVSATPSMVQRTAHEIGFSRPVIVEADPSTALAVAIAQADAASSALLVTGSLYLVGAARGRWYPADAIVEQRSPWPNPELPTTAGHP